MLDKEQIYEGNLILVNPDHKIRVTKKNMVLQSLGYDVRLKGKAAQLLLWIFKEIGSGNQIVPVSGYRSLEEQMQIYKNTLSEKGIDFTQKFVALPGHSEHQSGLAIDLGLRADTIDYICPNFPYQGICKQFREKASIYGFIERYPKEKESITGIAHEPWHFRYVGYPHANVMTRQKLTLEEYIKMLKNYTQDGIHLTLNKQGSKMELFYVPAKESKTKLELSEHRSYDISGNNIDGFIVTSWEKKHER